MVCILYRCSGLCVCTLNRCSGTFTSLVSPVSIPSQFWDSVQTYAEYALCAEGVLCVNLDEVAELGWVGNGTTQGRGGHTNFNGTRYTTSTSQGEVCSRVQILKRWDMYSYTSFPLVTKKLTLGWVVNGEKTPRWAAGGNLAPMPPMGKRKSVTPSTTLAHPGLMSNTFTLS